jgi:hypothetical protein
MWIHISTPSYACLQLLAHAGSSLADIFTLKMGVDTFLRNVGSHKNYTTPHPRKPAFFIVTSVKTSNLTKEKMLNKTFLEWIWAHYEIIICFHEHFIY